MSKKSKTNISLYLVLTNPEYFIEGNLDYAFSVYQSPGYGDFDGRQIVGHYDLDIEIDMDVIMKDALAQIVEEEGRHQKALNDLQDRRQKLMALPAPPPAPLPGEDT